MLETLTNEESLNDFANLLIAIGMLIIVLTLRGYMSKVRKQREEFKEDRKRFHFRRKPLDK